MRVDGEAERFAVPPSVYRSFDATVEADWSQAGFWYAARFLGNRVELRGLNEASAQGDRVVAALYERFKPAGEQSVDVSDCPDLLPPLAVMAILTLAYGVIMLLNDQLSEPFLPYPWSLVPLVVVLASLVWYAVRNGRANRDYFGM